MSNARVAFVISIIVAVCTLPSGSYADDHKAWLENFKAARHFSCKHPRPRAIFAEELLKKQVGPGETIVPAYTVLHRCDGYSGCCLHTNQICSVNGSSPVQLTFQRLGISGKSYVTVTAYNHTACVCVPRNEQPKRLHWLEVIPVQLEIASGQATLNGYNLILLGMVTYLVAGCQSVHL